jgi:RNA polymerase sigma factor for flagellar operon FliA
MLSEEHKQQLISEYAPIIKLMAGRLAVRMPPSVEVDDLVQVGVIGFLEALERYDPSRNIQFKTYAEIRVRGAMLDYLRSLDWVPTSLRRKIKHMKETERQLEAQLGRSLTREEIAKAIGETPENTEKLLRYNYNSSMISLYQETRDGDSIEWVASIADERALDPEDVLQQEDLLDSLAAAISDLPYREKLVLSLYYHEGLTMKEISKVLEVTVSRVSQIHSAAIRSVQKKLSSLIKEVKGI